MNAEEERIAQEAINYLKAHGLTIDQGWHLNGTPPSDVAAYLDRMIEGWFPTDENELVEQVVEMIETELGQASGTDANRANENEALRERKESEMNTTNREKRHAPSHLRGQFQEWLDHYKPDGLQEIDIRPVAALFDALADCGDIPPADYCDQLDIPKGSTYAEAVADVRQWSAKHQSQSSCVEGTKSKPRAAESEGLGPLVGDGFVVGYHPDINGPGTELVDFTPTRAELMTLGYHYLERFFAVQEMGANGYSGSFEVREGPFTWRRFKSISEALSPGKPIEEFQQHIDRRWAEIDELRRRAEQEAGELDEEQQHRWQEEGF